MGIGVYNGDKQMNQSTCREKNLEYVITFTVCLIEMSA